MEQELKQDLSVRFSRIYVSRLIRAWRSRIYNQSLYDGSLVGLTDKELAKMVGITPASFSRLSSQVTTCSHATLVRLYMAIKSTLGEEVFNEVEDICYKFAYNSVYGR